jgi:hypothetical protein
MDINLKSRIDICDKIIDICDIMWLETSKRFWIDYSALAGALFTRMTFVESPKAWPLPAHFTGTAQCGCYFCQAAQGLGSEM